MVNGDALQIGSDRVLYTSQAATPAQNAEFVVILPASADISIPHTDMKHSSFFSSIDKYGISANCQNSRDHQVTVFEGFHETTRSSRLLSISLMKRTSKKNEQRRSGRAE